MEIAISADLIFYGAEKLVTLGIDLTSVIVTLSKLRAKPDTCGSRQNSYLLPLRLFRVHSLSYRPNRGPGRPLRFAAHRQPLCWNFMYHSRIVLSVGGSVRLHRHN